MYKRQVVSYGTPILHNNKVLGTVIASVDLNAFAETKTSSDNYSSMWVTICNGSGSIVWDSETLDDVGKNIVTDFTVDEKQKQELSDRMAAQTAFSMEKERPDGTETTVFYCPVKVGGETWWSSTGLYTSDAQRAVRSTTMLLLLLSALALVLILLTVTMVLKRMLAPVQHVVCLLYTSRWGTSPGQCCSHRGCHSPILPRDRGSCRILLPYLCSKGPLR